MIDVELAEKKKTFNNEDNAPKTMSTGYKQVDEIEVSYAHGRGCLVWLCNAFTWLITIICPFFWCGMVHFIDQWQRAIILKMGQWDGTLKEPGIVFINPMLDDIRKIDLRVKTIDVPPQQMMTKDAVSVKVNAIVYIKVNFEAAQRSVLNVQNYLQACRLLATSTLRAVIGENNLDRVLSASSELGQELTRRIQEPTDKWGVCVERVEISDVNLPPNMQRAMASAAEAEREANAKKINAEGELISAEKLSEAANMISAANGGMQLRYLHTLKNIAAEQNSTILFPLPLNILDGIKEVFTNSASQNKEFANPV